MKDETGERAVSYTEKMAEVAYKKHLKHLAEQKAGAGGALGCGVIVLLIAFLMIFT
jgi:uncharacterized spore protein YtfJ